jgi:hypothetical protein
MRIPLAQRERLFYHDLVNPNEGVSYKAAMVSAMLGKEDVV